ncbi:MAG TPA: hypothetical protein VFM88_14240 [Vicinamibacteria bacterium]|nr:hypothetical protein [Vicinamibacteria bacterium]
MRDSTTPGTVGERAAIDPVIEAYKKDVDRTLLRENLRLTPDERLRKLTAFMRSLQGVRAATEPGRR